MEGLGMTGPSRQTLADIVKAYGASKKAAVGISWADAETEIAKALGVSRDTAVMVLYGLCATTSLRCFTADRQIIDTDEAPLADFVDKIAFVDADDIRDWLRQSRRAPLTKHRDIVIGKLLASDVLPGKNTEWKVFCDRVRDECNGWRKVGKPAGDLGTSKLSALSKPCAWRRRQGTFRTFQFNRR
jgi:hypothetical protein